MKLIVLFLFLLLVSGLVAADQTDSATSEERNPFQTSYKSIRQPVLPAAGAPKIFRGVDRASDDQRLLEDGFDILGYSRFEAADVLPDKALEQAVTLKADLVLVYTARAGGVPASVKMEAARARSKVPSGEAPADARGSVKDPLYYAYQATYWTRLPPPVLGLHVRDRKDDDVVEQGIIVMAVINGSPAFNAGLLAGDTLIGLGGTELRTAEELLKATQRYVGQAVELSWLRGGATLRQTVKLNEKSQR